MKLYTLNAFTTSPRGGNPAGVCLGGENLTDREMQETAARMGLSETAFVLPSSRADFRVRFFTPSMEVDLCGHATIATFFLLRQKGLIGEGGYTQETGAGILGLEIGAEGNIMMEQTCPVYGETAGREEIADSLNIPCDFLPADLPPRIVSTGLADLIVPVRSLEALQCISPDFGKIEAISRKLGVSGYHLFTTETLSKVTAHCRNFAPLCAIDEEAATGTATGATCAYMHRYGLLDGTDTENLIFEQGYTMNRPSEIHAALEIGESGIRSVRVGGRAVITGEL